MRRVLLALLLCLLAVSPAFAAPTPRPFLDLDFDAVDCTSSWFPFALGSFQQGLDSSVAWSGSQSIRLQYNGGVRWAPGAGYGLVSQGFPAADAAGKRVRFSAYIQTEDVRPGHAGCSGTAPTPGDRPPSASWRRWTAPRETLLGRNMRWRSTCRPMSATSRSA